MLLLFKEVSLEGGHTIADPIIVAPLLAKKLDEAFSSILDKGIHHVGFTPRHNDHHLDSSIISSPRKDQLEIGEQCEDEVGVLAFTLKQGNK